jgi:hypothetical protein
MHDLITDSVAADGFAVESTGMISPADDSSQEVCKQTIYSA